MNSVYPEVEPPASLVGESITIRAVLNIAQTMLSENCPRKILRTDGTFAPLSMLLFLYVPCTMNDTSRHGHSIPSPQDRHETTISSGAKVEWSAVAVRPPDHKAKICMPALTCCQGLLVLRG